MHELCDLSSAKQARIASEEEAKRAAWKSNQKHSKQSLNESNQQVKNELVNQTDRDPDGRRDTRTATRCPKV